VKRRVALITGGTRGIGKGVALSFAQSGYNVVVCGRKLPDLDAFESEFSGYQLLAPLYVEADVADMSSMQSVVRSAVEHFGGLDVLCANAGIFPSARLEDMTGELLDEVLAINVKGTFFSVQAALPELKKSTSGRVILTSSITGPITGYPGWSHYGASKAAQLGFMRTAALELARFGITVNAILPGNILTEGLREMGSEYISGMTKTIPLGRLGTVTDIGALAVFLASEAAGYITGQSVVVDGGQILPESLESVEG